MKKKILSLILALSLTISLFSVPASAASKPSIGVSTQLDVDSVSAWKRYFTAASITYMDSGAFNGALYLTNNVDYRLSVLLGSSFSPSSDWTVEFRMYCSGVSSDEQDTASGTFTLFGYDALALKGNKFATNASAYSNLPVGVWNHYAFVKSGSTYSVYVNGSRSMGWAADVGEAIAGNPLLLLFCIIPLVGLGVGLFRRLLGIR